MLKVKMLILFNHSSSKPCIKLPRANRSRNHYDAHRKDPNDESPLVFGFDCQDDEGNQRDAGYAIGFKSVRCWSNAISRVVARAVGDHAGIARIVFLDAEN